MSIAHSQVGCQSLFGISELYHMHPCSHLTKEATQFVLAASPKELSHTLSRFYHASRRESEESRNL
jgi:hypothetical protein